MQDQVFISGTPIMDQARTPTRPVTLPDWPVYALTEDLFPVLKNWHQAGRRIALATLVRIDGSSPRPLGSEMAINDAGEVRGFVSGGCVEGAVASEALSCLQDGQPRLLDYGTGSSVLDIHLECGGRIGIFVRPLTQIDGLLHILATARGENGAPRQIISVQTSLVTGRIEQISPGLFPSSETCFSRPYAPPVRLVLAGSDPITLALIQLADLYPVEISLLRPAGPSSPPPGLGAENYHRQTLADLLKNLRLDAWTALYCLSHNAEQDEQIALHGLRSEAFSVGILGSRRKIPGRLAAFRAAGLADHALARLHMPAGLEIQAHSPAEIALSIMAEIIAKRPLALPFYPVSSR